MTELFELVIRASRAITPQGERACAVGVRDGRIVEVADVNVDLSGTREVTLAPDEVLLPGLVDTHVHINDPGRTEWEGFATATRAAAAGGITTLVDMPLNSIPPTVDADALEVKRATAEGVSHVDLGFWGGAVPSSLGHLKTLHEAGVLGFKCFLLHSGVDEFPHLEVAQMEEAMREIAGFGGLLIVHAEDEATIDHSPRAAGAIYENFLGSRPRLAEDRAIAAIIAAVHRTGCRTHVLHLSSSDALADIAQARQDGLPLTVETCPHYLYFNAEDIPDGATQFKCCPPIREQANRDALWQALVDGTIDCIVSDHSPCTVDLKRLDTGDFGAAWGGIASLQLSLSIIWTEAARRGIDLCHVVAWMSTWPAGLVGLAAKGALAVGKDADFCVFAPDTTFEVDAAKLHHRNRITAYQGRTLRGEVRATWLRGTQISKTGQMADTTPAGRQILRGQI